METNVLEVFERKLTKTEIKSMAQNAIDNVKENGNPLQLAETLSAIELFVKEVKADESFKDYVREEVTKNEKCFVSKSGAKIELAETGTKYDFLKCNDEAYTSLLKGIESLTETIKTRETFLKAVPIEGMDIVTIEGEVVKIFPPSKSSTSSYKITLAK